MISIRRRLTRELLRATLLLGGGGLLALYLAAREAVIDRFDGALYAKALAVETLTDVVPGGVQVRFSDRFLRGFDRRVSRDFYEMWNAAGGPVARSEALVGADLPRRPALRSKPRYWKMDLPNGRDGRAVTVLFAPKADGQEAAGPLLQLVVASDREDLDETLGQLIALAAGTAAVLVAATLWLIPRVLRRGLEPLERLGEQVAAIDSGSLGTRLDAGPLPQELLPIAGRLNELLGRIAESFARERRFSADLAHELRTPLAELRGMAECALKWPASRDGSLEQEVLAVASQMEAMVGHMLSLARGEQGQLAVRLETVRIDELVKEAWAAAAARAGDRGFDVDLRLEPVSAEADATLLRSVLGNLLENAADYTPKGGRIEIVAGAAVRPCVAIGNSADGLEPSDLPRLFERFWRKEAARSGGGRHVGLGLSLAKVFAEATGWALEASLPRPGWIVFTLAPKPPSGEGGAAFEGGTPGRWV